MIEETITKGMKTMDVCKERGLGYCGLACVLCNSADCPGCFAKIAGGDDCAIGMCAIKKGIDGCYSCPDYPCGEDILKNKRIRAFNRYAHDFGKDALIERLYINNQNGIVYHRPDSSAGDYDMLETEDEIYKILRYGRNNPYEKCPTFETQHFKLRQVRVEDAEDLLICYADLSTWVFYNNDFCKRIFATQYPTLDEIKALIRAWLDEYKNNIYVRLSIIDKSTGKAIGTIELFDKAREDKHPKLEHVRNGVVLHIDLAPEYEKQSYISELLALADNQFFVLFGVKYLLSWAEPTATERISALMSAGYIPFDWGVGREHYYSKSL